MFTVPTPNQEGVVPSYFSFSFPFDLEILCSPSSLIIECFVRMYKKNNQKKSWEKKRQKDKKTKEKQEYK